MKRKPKMLCTALILCCMMLINTSYTMAGEETNQSYEMAERCEGSIYNSEGGLIVLDLVESRASCTHIPCNTVTDTVWQHVHTGLRCDVYTANATWCKCCNTILRFNSNWVYSYTHYGCNK